MLSASEYIGTNNYFKFLDKFVVERNGPTVRYHSRDHFFFFDDRDPKSSELALKNAQTMRDYIAPHAEIRVCVSRGHGFVAGVREIGDMRMAEEESAA